MCTTNIFRPTSAHILFRNRKTKLTYLSLNNTVVFPHLFSSSSALTLSFFLQYIVGAVVAVIWTFLVRNLSLSFFAVVVFNVVMDFEEFSYTHFLFVFFLSILSVYF